MPQWNNRNSNNWYDKEKKPFATQNGSDFSDPANGDFSNENDTEWEQSALSLRNDKAIYAQVVYGQVRYAQGAAADWEDQGSGDFSDKDPKDWYDPADNAFQQAQSSSWYTQNSNDFSDPN